MDRSMKKVLITDPIDSSCIKILEENHIQVDYKPKLAVADILESIKDADGLIVRSGTTVTAEIIDAAKKLKIIGRAGVGVDNIDCDAATRNGVVVINAPSGNTLSAAEHTCAMICSMARHIPQGCASLKAEKWDRAKLMGNELHGKTLAIVGLGRIGREVAFRMQSFGMTTVGFDPLVSSDESATFGVEWLTLEEIWPRADFITLHVPLIPQTKDMVNKTVFEKCKKGVRIVNVARGGIIDEEAIYEALENGQCGGLGVDVYVEEPPKEFNLIKHPKVVCTPHLGASTYEAQIKVAQEIANQFVDFVGGRPLYGAVNAPSLNEAMKTEWKPWAVLAQALGQIAVKTIAIESERELNISVNKYGCELEKDGNLLLTCALVGILKGNGAVGVNLVNAPSLASAAGIKSKVEKKENGPSVKPLVALEIITKDGKRHVFSGYVEGSLPLLLAIDSAKFGGGIPLKGSILLFKSSPNQKSLASIIDAVSSFDIPITYACESDSTEGVKWYSIGIAKPMESTAHVSTVSATFVTQIELD